MKYCHSLFALLGVASAVALTSCQDEDLGYTSDQIAYRTNFEKMYGSVKDIPTWDFSSYNLRQMGLAGGPGASGMTRALGTNTRAAGPGKIIDNSNLRTTDPYFHIVESTLNYGWLNNHMAEGQDHASIGEPFKLVKPEPASGQTTGNDFLIIPIYQGHSGMAWDLHMVAADNDDEIVDYKLWEKSQDMGFVYDFTYSENSQIIGEEYFYDTRFNDIDVPKDGGFENDKVKKLKLGRVLTNGDNTDYVASATYFKVSFLLPAHSSISGAFGDIFNNNDGWTFNLENPTDAPQIVSKDFIGSYTDSEGTHNYDIRTSTSDWPTVEHNSQSNLYNFGLKNVTCTNCELNTFADAKTRVRIFIAYDGDNHTRLEFIDGRKDYIHGHTINRHYVLSKPMRIDCSKIRDDFYFYLDITQKDEYHDNFGAVGDKRSSDNRYMLALLDVDTSDKLFTDASGSKKSLNTIVRELYPNIPSNIDACEYFVIGAEDAFLTESDYDYNDVIFLVVGLSKAPKIKTEYVEKRYMIEDLGSTFDFDFNDIVIDVTQAKYRVPGLTTKTEKTTATLRHLCGTIPFKVQVGNTVLGDDNGKQGQFMGCNAGCSAEGDGCNPANHTPGTNGHLSGKYSKLEFEVTGWKPDENNIIVTTWPSKAGDDGWTDSNDKKYLGLYPEGSSTFTFPTKGNFPYIIATDQTVMWKKESVNVPKEWFNTWPDEYWQNTNQQKPNVDPTPQPEEYGTEINFTADGQYGANVTLGKILSGKTSITLAFVPQNGNTFSFKGCIGGSYQNGNDWIWQQTKDSFNVNCTDGTTAIKVTLSLNNKDGENIASKYGIGSTYDATLALWSDENNEIYIGGTKVTKDNIEDYFVKDKIKVFYK